MKCRNCGKELTEDEIMDGYCSECGAQITLAWQMAGLRLWG